MLTEHPGAGVYFQSLVIFYRDVVRPVQEFLDMVDSVSHNVGSNVEKLRVEIVKVCARVCVCLFVRASVCVWGRVVRVCASVCVCGVCVRAWCGYVCVGI